MPIYEYECDECGHHLEALQKISDPPVAECEECHSNKLKKLISHSTFHLKGTGWYVTDYASKSGSTHKEGNKEGKDKGSSGNTEKANPEKKAKSGTESSSKKDTPTPSKNKE